DSGWEQAAAHWELAIAYLEGTDGVPRNRELAATHFDEAFQRRPGRERLASINAGTGERYDADVILARLADDARALLEQKLGWDRVAEVRFRFERVERLVEVHAPEVLIEAEVELLREAADAAGGSLSGDLERQVRAVLAAGAHGSG